MITDRKWNHHSITQAQAETEPSSPEFPLTPQYKFFDWEGWQAGTEENPDLRLLTESRPKVAHGNTSQNRTRAIQGTPTEVPG